MTIELKILGKYYDTVINKITSQVIKSLQNIKDTLSADDSGLVNCWDEICVQVQGEVSYFWNVYEYEIERLVRIYLENLKEYEKCLLWMFTENGDEYYERSSSDELMYNIEDIVEYIKINCILSEAADWSNKRIRNYLGF